MLVCTSISLESCIILGAVFVLAGIAVLFISKRITLPFLAFAAFSLGCIVFAVNMRYNISNYAQINISDKVYSVQGYVYENVPSDDGQLLSIRVTSLDGTDAKTPVPVKLNVYENLPIEIGTYITADLTFKTKESAADTLYSNFSAVYAQLSGDIQYTQNTSMSPYLHIMKLRQKLAFSMQTLFGNELGSFLNKAVFGWGDISSSKTVKLFYDSGIGHILAVSGLHVSIICAAVMFLLSKLSLHKTLSCILSILACVFYVLLTGAPYSAVRAGIMMIIFLLSQILGRDYDSLNSLSIAALLILSFSPRAVFSYGFLMSVACSFCIIIFSPHILSALKSAKALKPILKYELAGHFASAFSVTLSANIALIIFSVFGIIRIPVISIPVNVLVSPFIPIVIALAPLCALLASLGSVFTYLAYPLSVICAAGVKIITSLAGISVYFREFSLSFSGFEMRLLLIISAAIILSAVYYKNTVYRRFVSVCICVIIVAMSYMQSIFYNDNLIIYSDNTGTSKGAPVLITVGGYDILFAVCESYTDYQSVMSLSDNISDNVCDILIYPQTSDSGTSYAKKLCSQLAPKAFISDSSITYDEVLTLYCSEIFTDSYKSDNLDISLNSQNADIIFDDGAHSVGINLNTDDIPTVIYDDKEYKIASNREVFNIKHE